MTRYIVVHCRHEGCYDFKCDEDHVTQRRMTTIRINPPKMFMFDDSESAGEFFEEYIADIDCFDIKCRKGVDIEHEDDCTCGIVEVNDEGYPILFYNRIHQIFLTEVGSKMFEPIAELKHNICNMNLTNRLIRRCRRLNKEQRDQYIELGRVCQECEDAESSKKQEEKKVVEVEVEVVVESKEKEKEEEKPKKVKKATVAKPKKPKPDPSV
jgi:hypothetical protein